MRKHVFMKFTLICLMSFAFVMTLVAGAMALECMVTKIENNFIIINRGIDVQMKPGTVLYVTRLGQPVGSIKVVQVDEYNSACQVVEVITGQQFQKGDMVSLQPYIKPQTTTGQPSVRPSPAITAGPGRDYNKERMESQKLYEKTIVDRYKEVVKGKTVAKNYGRGPGGILKIDTWPLFYLSTTVLYGRSFGPGDVTTIIGMIDNTNSTYAATQRPDRVRNVQILITLWDTEYLDAFAAYYAFKEANNDPRVVNVIKENVYRQKGLDKFYVFQIKMINPGPGSVQLAPFPIHFFLNVDGKRIGCDSYDEILDKALLPNQAVNGYVYFKKNDAQGKPISTKGLIIDISDILGNNDQLRFK